MTYDEFLITISLVLELPTNNVSKFNFFNMLEIYGYFPMADNLITLGSSFSTFKIAVEITTVASVGLKDICAFIFYFGNNTPSLGSNWKVWDSNEYRNAVLF